MKPYTSDKNRNELKFEKGKFNSKVGLYTITKSSKLEAKNANRSRKKSKRQEGKKEGKKVLQFYPYEYYAIIETSRWDYESIF